VDEALALFREALATIEAHPAAAWNPTRLVLWLRIGQLLHFMGQSADARPALAAAERLAEELAATDALPEIQLTLARVALTLGKGEEARAACDRALQGMDGHELAVDCLLARSQAHLALGAYTDAVLDATAAVDAAVTPADQGKAQAAFAELMLDGTPNLHGVAVAHLEAARQALEATGDRIALAGVYGSLGLAKLRAGAYDEASEAYTNQLMLGLEVGYQDGYVSSLAGLAEVALRRGNALEALKMVGDAYRDARQAQNAVLGLECQLVTARCLVRAGRYAEAVAELRRLANTPAGLSQRLRLLATQAEAWLELGDAAEAWRATEALRELSLRTGATWSRVPLAAWRSRLAPRLGLPQDPNDQALLTATSHQGREGDRLTALDACVRLALLEERWEDAAALAETGATLAEEAASTPFLAAWAEAELALGRTGAADHFEALATLASDPETQARAAFGLAASRPYAQGAAELAAQANSLLQDLAATLAPEDRTWFWAVPERVRIREGNFIGFGLPRVRATSRPFLGPRGSLH
jgi:tetratricopeptide (TPR) repeat protein